MKVLIADDKPQYISHLTKICKGYGLECTPETDPAMALSRIKKNEFFDILIIDLSFSQAKINGEEVTLTEPKINGLKILEVTKQKYMENQYTPYIPILNIAEGTKELYRFEQKAGIIFDFIERPFKDSKIKIVIEKAIKFLSNKRETTR